MTDSPLIIQFGDAIALVSCDDPKLNVSFKRYFCHCLIPAQPPEAEPPVVSYRIITRPDQTLLLQQDGAPVEIGDNTPFYIYFHVTRQVAARLVVDHRQQPVFHAAGLAKNGQGLILCGQADSGKSTLAAWLTATGFDFLTDEMVAVSLDPLQMYGLACPLVLKADSAFVWQQWLPADYDDTRINFFGGAAWLDPDLLRPGCVQTGPLDPQLLIFPHYHPEAALSLQPVSAAEAAYLLMPRLVNATNWPDRGFSFCIRLAQQLTTYRLTYSDVAQAAESVWNLKFSLT